ncbi:MAG: hypothetical protein AAF581_20535 [Planctomycetota bacterium]
MTRPLVVALCFVLGASPLALISAGDADLGAAKNSEGVKLFQSGDFARALQCFLAAREQLPESEEVRRNLGKTYAALAIGILESAMTQEVGNAPYQRALENLQKALLHWKGDADTYHAVALCHIQLKELEAAQKALERGVALQPDAYPSWRLLASVLERLQKFAQAERALDSAARLQPSARAEIDLRRKRIRYDREALTEYPAIDSARFRVVYPPALGREKGEQVQKLLDEVCADLEKRWAVQAPKRTTVICYPPGEFAERTGFHEDVGGAFDGKIRVAFPKELRLGGLHLAQVVRHEGAHLMLNQLGVRAPRWLDEGLAQFIDGESREALRPQFVELVRKHPGLGVQDRETRFRENDPSSWGALYLHGYFFVEHVCKTAGQFRLDMIVREAGRGKTWDEAFQAVLSKPIATLDREWRATLLAPKKAR